MDKDCRTEFVREVETDLVNVVPRELIDQVLMVVIRRVDEYDISTRCTEVAIRDSENDLLLKRYLASVAVSGKSVKTIKAYGLFLRRFGLTVGKNLVDVTEPDIKLFLGENLQRGLKETTVDGYRAYLSAFYKWATIYGYVDKNPCENITPIKKPKVRRLKYSDVELDKMVSAIENERDRAIYEVLLSSGLRASEFLALDRWDIDFQTLRVNVKNGKGKKDRVTYITNVAAEHLKNYLKTRTDDNPCMFYSHNKCRLSARGLSKILKKISKDSGVTNIHPHRFRRTFASNMAENGAPIQVIQQLLGHSSLDTTMVYVNTSDEQLEFTYKRYA